MAEENSENKGARSAQEAEMKKLGITPHSERKGEKSEKDSELEDEEVEELEDEDTEDQDDEEEDSEDESEEDEEDSEDEEESEEESENEEDEDEEDEEESQSHKKKGVSFKQFNALRSDLRKANKQIADLVEKGSKKTEDVPDDFQKRVDDLAKEIGVENPDGLKKIMALVEDVIKGTKTDFDKKLTDLEEKYGKIIKATPVQDEFGKEWKSFEKSFSKEYPNATDEEVEAAQKLMNRLSHTPGIGGKAYKDADGRELLDPYELDYIYFKNKDQFAELVTGKKVRGLESSRTQGIKKGQEGKEENKPLRKGASVKEIQEYEKRSARAIEGIDNLSEPVDDTI